MAAAVLFRPAGCRPVQVAYHQLKQGKLAARERVQLFVGYPGNRQFLQLIAPRNLIYIFDKKAKPANRFAVSLTIAVFNDHWPDPEAVIGDQVVDTINQVFSNVVLLILAMCLAIGNEFQRVITPEGGVF